MTDGEKEKKSYFWELVGSNILGTATGCVIAYYLTTKDSIRLDKYIDKTIGFLENVKKKAAPRGYDMGEREKDI